MTAVWGSTEKRTLFSILEDTAARDANKRVLWFGDQAVTAGELLERSIATSNALGELGVQRGDKVAVLMANAPEHLYTAFAAGSLGAVEMATNTAYKGDFLSGLLRKIETKVVLVDADLAPNIAAIADELPNLTTVLVRDRPGVDTTGLALPSRVSVHPMSILLEGESRKLEADGGRWDEPSTIQYTSGTTGPSKASLMSQNFVVNWVHEMAKWWVKSPHDVFYASGLPLFHGLAKGLGALAAVYGGATCVLEERLSISTFWARVREMHVTATACPEAVLIMLWNLERSELEADNSLHTIVAAPIPADLLRSMEERWGVRMVGQYALSEAVPLVVGGIDEPLKVGTSGKVKSDLFDVRCFDENDEEVPVGEVGEVVVRPKKPKIMFDGYYGDEAATLATWRNLWFHTGDMAKFDEDGNFIFVDRKKDYIRRRAENISSFEVERAAMRFAGIAQVAACGVKSDMGEEEVKICVVAAPGASLSLEDLFVHCYENMPYYAVPRYIELVDTLPLTPSGKVQKALLREAGVTAATWDAAAAGFNVSRSGLTRPTG